MIRRDGHIRVLPLHVANKIAAGEVVERPASVVKELLENAIDAGAKSIKVTVTQGGRKLIAVQDDGCGMSKDDAILSLERQATSKILDVDDIERIATLGFRGEAIPSIASVSRFTLITRTHDSDEATQLQVNAGTLAEVRSAGAPPGTLVEVRDLFCNVPARRKFLKSALTEESHIKQIFTIHALAHPAIGFTLTIDGRELYRLAPADSLGDRVHDLFGDDFLEKLLPLANDLPAFKNVSVTGYIERPNLHEPSRREQYVFVNGRPATAPSIAYALREAFPRRPGDVKPAAILFLSVPPTEVDVNVHPTKREVRFRDASKVRQALMTAIEQALSHPADSSISRFVDSSIPSNPANSPIAQSTASPSSNGTGESTNFNEPIQSTNRRIDESKNSPSLSLHPVPTQIEFAIEPGSTQSRPWQWFRFLAQTSQGYLLIETDGGIVTLDPRAARERIIYERALDAILNRAPVSQPLLIPETVRLSPADASRITAAIELVNSLGFNIEPFGDATFKIDAVPTAIKGISAADVLATIAHDLAEQGVRRTGEHWREERIAKAVAKSCIGMDAKMTEEGAVKLVEDLCTTRMPYVSPRAKITMYLTTSRELARKFGRD